MILEGPAFLERISDFSSVLWGAIKRDQTTKQEAMQDSVTGVSWQDLSIAKRNARLIQAQQEMLLSPDQSQALDGLLRAQQRMFAREARRDTVEMFGLGSEPFYASDDTRLQAICQHAAMRFRRLRDLRLSVRLADRLSKKEELDTETIQASFEKAWGPKSEEHYWRSTIGAWGARSRSGGQIHAMRDDGIVEGRIVAMLDERTSPICRLLHGKIIQLAESEAQLSGVIDPGTSTFVGETRSLTTDDPNMLLTLPGGRILAELEDASIATFADPVLAMGSWKQFITDEELAVILGPPPYHLLCRSIVVPADWPDELGLRADVELTDPVSEPTQ